MKCFVFFILVTAFIVLNAAASDAGFTNSLRAAYVAEKRGDFKGAEQICNAACKTQKGNPGDLCVLAHLYCNLTFLTSSTAVQKELIGRALSCARQAVADAPGDATAHASMAVCYAKTCAFKDIGIKAKLAYSRLFKEEAEKAIALDPKEDIAYYLLGRWNYGIAKLGFFSRAYVKMVYGGMPKASLQEAVVDFKKACEIAPNRVLNHAGLAMAYGAMGESSLEEAELEKCCALKPSGPEEEDAWREAEWELRGRTDPKQALESKPR